MTFAEFQSLKPGDRITVARYKITGRKPCVDEDTGEAGTRAVMRKCGNDSGTITKRQDREMVVVEFDQPVPDINNAARSQKVWSVYFRDVIGRV